MGNWQWWMCQLRRLRESEVYSSMRFFIRRYQTPRRLALVLCALLFILYCLFSPRTSVVETVSQSCLQSALLSYDEELKDFSIARDGDSVNFIGNGYIGVDENGELRASSGKTLSMLTGFRPLVSLKLEGAYDIKQAILTDFRKGKIIKTQCFSVDSECVCATTTTFAHRTKKHILVQEIKITNPTKSAVRAHMSRAEAPTWRSESERTSDMYLLTRDDLGVGGRSGGSVICSSVVDNMIIQPKREESFQYTCVIDIREKVGDTWKAASREQVTSTFTHTKKEFSSIVREHDNAWGKLNEVTFHLSHSFAPNVLNGVVINATRYAIMSNVRAPLLEDGVSPQERMIIESKGSRRDLCYTGHSTLLYPSRLWTKTKNSEELVSLVDTWLLTLEKRGCAHVISMGASGVGQALVLSLSAGTFHDGHLELGMDPADMHREISVSGLELNDASKSKLSFQVGIHDDNRPFLMVSSSSSSEVYACDGGCRSDPIRISPSGTKITVMLTKPLTSILYLAPNRKHLTQLRNAIHVSEIDVAPAHEDDILSAHKGEDGGLPTFVWVILGVFLVAFHIFLVKLLYSEWKKADSTPYNPFLRQKYFREH
ncbi:hypothetical protein PENTCL1PPCAC_17947 [Pristionchus entomophagus]|uniref:Uncharacterized protein n=1 Tax=Pristionchus entomophagus TaxID=358040 RepID=A0AAV5TN29_9BILA|nr:hypothetical protein PENTCL1PPCAC_17947 [Pristionchus entomophagus]